MTGLDATSSSDILTSLSDMAALGMTVVAVIHQPRFSSFMQFDQVRAFLHAFVLGCVHALHAYGWVHASLACDHHMHLCMDAFSCACMVAWMPAFHMHADACMHDCMDA